MLQRLAAYLGFSNNEYNACNGLAILYEKRYMGAWLELKRQSTLAMMKDNAKRTGNMSIDRWRRG